ncbi:MAG TPA: RNA methyltransferase [Sphingobacteriaceae bacterium]|nr:RNA methyltransferase [Sphingobacteriaceae bacterium]
MSNKIPPALVRKLGADPLFDVDGFMRSQESKNTPTAIRLNPGKKTPEHLNRESHHVPWCSSGIYLHKRPLFTLDPYFHAGHYYVQEASSMFLEQVITQLKLDEKPLLALDLCAAPGGKSTLLQSALHADSLLVSNELIKSRVNTLEDNMIRWGYANSVVTNNDPSAFSRLPHFFDLMLVDAPCSGSGMFRKEKQAVEAWSEAAVKLCRERQQRILAQSIACLKPGGILIYSTCSYSEEENEQMSDWLIQYDDLDPIALALEDEWGVEQTYSPLEKAPGYRFYPHRLQGEGFFLAVFRRRSAGMEPNTAATLTAAPLLKKKSVKNKKQKEEALHIPTEFFQKYLLHPEEYQGFYLGKYLYAIDQRHKDSLYTLKKMLYIIHAGLCLGTPLRDDLIPHHAIALSRIRRPDLPVLRVNLEQALNYLRKSNLDQQALSAANQQVLTKGWVLIQYEHATLGWVKVLDGRINNYYPKDWRIVHL